MVGKKQVEVAMQLGLKALEVRKYLRGLRNHFWDQTPHAPEYPPEVNTDQAKRDYDLRYLWNKRFQEAREPLEQLEQLIWETEIVLGEDLNELLIEYNKIYNAIGHAAQDQLFPRKYRLINEEREEKMANTLYGSPDDEINKQIDETARKFKEFARRHIEPSKGWDSNDKRWS